MKSFLLGLGLLASVGMVQAAPQLALHPAAGNTYIPAPPPPAGLLPIFDNIARKYPKGFYNTVAGRPIVGPNSTVGLPETWMAAPFTPATNMTLKRVQVGISWGGVGTNAAVVAIYDDSAGLPGNALTTWHATGMSGYGSCCSLVVKNTAGLPLTGGQQYWLAIKTDNSSKDAYIVWNYNTADQVTLQNVAIYCKDSSGHTCSGPSGEWLATPLLPTVAYAVYGN